jgi:mycothiol system anti-sigma-R factor
MSRKCDEAQEKLYLYLDREMTWYRRARVRWHLWRCPPCYDGFQFERKLKLRIRKDCAETVSPELYERLRAYLDQGKTDG